MLLGVTHVVCYWIQWGKINSRRWPLMAVLVLFIRGIIVQSLIARV